MLVQLNSKKTSLIIDDHQATKILIHYLTSKGHSETTLHIIFRKSPSTETAEYDLETAIIYQFEFLGEIEHELEVAVEQQFRSRQNFLCPPAVSSCQVTTCNMQKCCTSSHPRTIGLEWQELLVMGVGGKPTPLIWSDPTSKHQLKSIVKLFLIPQLALANPFGLPIWAPQVESINWRRHKSRFNYWQMRYLCILTHAIFNDTISINC